MFVLRLFDNDAQIRLIGEGLITLTLPRENWTHEAHLATCVWIILERPDLIAERDLPGLIRRYNESVGGVNDDNQGYHETITQMFVLGVHRSLARSRGLSLSDRVNRLLESPEGRRDWPLAFYSRERLFSPEARRSWVPPDLVALPNGQASDGGRAG